MTSVSPKISRSIFLFILTWLPFEVLGAALVVLGARFWLICNYATQVPFLDQWGGEGLYLYRPWLLGQLTWHDLFQRHNEHRILFTRLLDLFILNINGQWDSILIMMINTIIPLTFIMLIASYGRRFLSRSQSLILSLVTMLC